MVNVIYHDFSWYCNGNATAEPGPERSKSFSKNAYSNHFVVDSEVELALQVPRLILSPVQKQTQSLFLQMFPNDIQAKIFGFLKKDLKTCLLVCKQFNINAINQALSNISIDFRLLENQLNLELGKIETPSLFSSPKTVRKDSLNLATQSKRISSFKAYCIFIIKNAEKDKDTQETKDVLKSLMYLQKSIVYMQKVFIEASNKNLTTQPRMQPQISFRVRY